MIKYLVVILDDSSVSYCHYSNRKDTHSLIPLEHLKSALENSLRENMNVTFVLSNEELSDEYKSIIHSVSHSLVVPITYRDEADIYVAETIEEFLSADFHKDRTYVLKLSKNELYEKSKDISASFNKIARLNIVITDVNDFSDEDIISYKSSMEILCNSLMAIIANGSEAQVNICTDRIYLDRMNNCNAGWETIAVCPDGKYYPCPGFYYDGKYCLGDTQNGIVIPNSQLFKLKYAPICRECDAFHCRRCVWLNERMTYEVNTPSHEQCVIAHLERNASRQLLADIRTLGQFLPETDIKEIDYLDPFDVVTNRNRIQ